jgi:hypothetical protein
MQQQLNLAIEVQEFLQQISKTKVRQGVVENGKKQSQT